MLVRVAAPGYVALYFLLVCLPVGIFVYLTVDRFLKIKDKLRYKAVLFAGALVIGMMVIYFADWENIVYSLAVFLGCMWLCCEGSRIKRFVLGMMIAGIVYTYSAVIDNFLDVIKGTLLYGGMRVVCSLVLYLGARRLAPKREFELSSPVWRMVLLLTAAPVGIVLCLVVLGNYELPRNMPQLFALLCIALFSFAGLLMAVAVLARQGELEREQALSQMNRQYYRAMKEQNFEVRRLKHDLANHLQILAAMPKEQKDGYIRQLLENPVAYKTMRYCGDDTVNAVLCVKAGVMEQKGIDFQVRADIPVRLSLEETDICAILGNALDNAIEAVMLLPEKERYIRLEARFGKGILVVRVENPVREQALVEKDGLPESRKKDGSVHGYGLKSIREAVKKYGGTMEIKNEDWKFTLFLYM